jgi:NTE family protein
MIPAHTKPRDLPKDPATRIPRDDEDCILVLQGGGALGAYQAGVFEALSHGYVQPTWVAGISIGAINAALIAGNPAHKRVDRLRQFWERVSSSITLPLPSLSPLGTGLGLREFSNQASATQGAVFGVPGFFSPRFPPAPFQAPGTVGAISYYDTTPLQNTLEELVDFKLLNSGAVRISVGAVNVRTGNFEYFDSAKQAIDARHIMASGALPPGFAPVEIDDEHYWDGGLVSNTPLNYVLDQNSSRKRIVFQVDLFPARGDYPRNLDEVAEREKEIRFSSRTRMSTTVEMDRHVIAQAARRLLTKLPAELKNDPDVQALAKIKCEGSVDVVHLIYRSKHYEGQAKDYEFSQVSMQEHWDSGRADMAHTLHHPKWVTHVPDASGVRVFDLTN